MTCFGGMIARFLARPVRLCLLVCALGIGIAGPLGFQVAIAQNLAHTGPRMPDPNGMTVLVRTAITALNDANLTGNYTVFRDLGSPEFRSANTAASLSGVFASLRKGNINLAPVVLSVPRYRAQPALVEKNRLRLTGFFPTTPISIHFDMSFQWVDKRWRLYGIVVQTKKGVI